MIPLFKPKVRLRYILAVAKQMILHRIGPGQSTSMFEDAIKHISGAKYCAATTSGTTSLLMSIESLDLPKGSTVLFPAYTFLAGANACRFMGYNIRLVDIKEDTLCMDPGKVNITKDVSCVIFVNHNGYVGKDVGQVKSICDAHHCPMIEDSSQAIGIDRAGRKGDLGVFSFSVPKLVTTGQGGAVITDNPDIYKRILQIRDHGDNWKQTRVHNYIGINLKFNDILASYGLSQFKQLDKLVKKRKRIFDWYRRYIDIIDYGYDSSWGILYRTYKATEVIASLDNNGIQSSLIYKPINHNIPYQNQGAFPVAERISNTVVYLPFFLSISKSQVRTICNIIRKIK